MNSIDEKVGALLEQDVGDLKGKIVSDKRNLKMKECIVFINHRSPPVEGRSAYYKEGKRGLIKLGQKKGTNQKSK